MYMVLEGQEPGLGFCHQPWTFISAELGRGIVTCKMSNFN